jgi:hypothetical protein
LSGQSFRESATQSFRFTAGKESVLTFHKAPETIPALYQNFLSLLSFLYIPAISFRSAFIRYLNVSRYSVPLPDNSSSPTVISACVLRKAK